MLRYPEAEAIYKQLRKDQEGCVPANVLSEELAKPSQARQLQSMQDELFAIKNWIMTVRVLTTLLAITIVMKFFKGFRANPRLQIVADAIAKSVNNVAHFFLIFWTLFACFAIVAHVLFGSDIILFSSLVSSLEASMSTLMGEFEWYVQISGTKSGFLNSGLPLVETPIPD
eukprot:g33618.t1